MPLPSYARVTNLANGRSIVVRVNDRGPYTRNRIIDLSVGTAKALKFHGQGLASVRVEYLGRAPLDGSDDRMLMATLREGSPAPAPSNVMVASAKPFLSGLGGGATSQRRRAAAGRAAVPARRRVEPRRRPGPERRRDGDDQQAARKVGCQIARGRRRTTPAVRPADARPGGRLCAHAQPGRGRPDERPGALLKPGGTAEARRAHCSAAPRLLVELDAISTASRFPLRRKTL